MDNIDEINKEIHKIVSEQKINEPDPIVDIESQEENKLVISQSLMKQFLYHGEPWNYCPRLIYEDFILRKFGDRPTESMEKGNYFETHCLGGCARGRKVMDLPRKKPTAKQKAAGEIGSKSIDQERIDIQINRFRHLCMKKGVQVIPLVNTQVKVYKKWNDKVLLSGDFDIFPTTIQIGDDLYKTIIDLKLTGNINNTFGDFCWATPENMDHTQAFMYLYLISGGVDMDLNPHLREFEGMVSSNNFKFFYWVFDYKLSDITKLSDKLIEVKLDQDKISELKESIRKTIILYEEAEESGWKENPSFETCKGCPIQCEKAEKIQVI